MEVDASFFAAVATPLPDEVEVSSDVMSFSEFGYLPMLEDLVAECNAFGNYLNVTNERYSSAEGGLTDGEPLAVEEERMARQAEASARPKASGLSGSALLGGPLPLPVPREKAKAKARTPAKPKATAASATADLTALLPRLIESMERLAISR